MFTNFHVIDSVINFIAKCQGGIASVVKAPVPVVTARVLLYKIQRKHF